MKDFDGKVALVTGTTGIALATARRLAQGGAAIIACGIDRAANTAMQEGPCRSRSKCAGANG